MFLDQTGLRMSAPCSPILCVPVAPVAGPPDASTISICLPTGSAVPAVSVQTALCALSEPSMEISQTNCRGRPCVAARHAAWRPLSLHRGAGGDRPAVRPDHS